MRASEEEISGLLRELGAWNSGHFLLSSGLHSNQYVQCQKILQYPRHGLVLADELARQVSEAGLRPTVVVGPALGAVHWELLVAMALDRQAYQADRPIKAVFAERPEGKNDFEIRRGIEIASGEKVLVVEDVTTTGGSARKVTELVRRLGGDPVAIGAIVDRSGASVDFGLPFFALVKLDLRTYSAAECLMCQAGMPLSKPGSSSSKR